MSPFTQRLPAGGVDGWASRASRAWSCADPLLPCTGEDLPVVVGVARLSAAWELSYPQRFHDPKDPQRLVDLVDSLV